ncbi:hypothetical protein OZX67_07885 [Bifidobacterium sp. ESL0728]|uniref:hypothetical protein n=1 Tax=Bifidobacterium sp. ESL0728 TaxID=2983220 RepID=UPI0023F6691E|nr:hypothetical protein [Bifidobacterium sp. ESL0728]WEV58705.1 hypothetical protein OZX67_07885 [Bifidobacterium sp. ESL0728]
MTVPKKVHPKCMPDDVARRLKSGQRHAKKVAWLEADETAYGTPAAWSDSDYEGLPQCFFATPASTGVQVGSSFSFWWLLVFPILLFLLLLAYRNGGYILARHPNLDSAEISK